MMENLEAVKSEQEKANVQKLEFDIGSLTEENKDMNDQIESLQNNLKMKTAAYDSYVDKNKVLAEEVEHKVSFFSRNFFDFFVDNFGS